MTNWYAYNAKLCFLHQLVMKWFLEWAGLHHHTARHTISKTFSTLSLNHIYPKYQPPSFPNGHTFFFWVNFLVLSTERQTMHIDRFSDKKKNDFTRDSLSQVLTFNDFPPELVQGMNNGMDCEGSGYILHSKNPTVFLLCI